MKDRSSATLTSIKTNQQIVQLLKNSKKLNLPYITIWLGKQNNKHNIDYALLVNKNQFKFAVLRNKVKRQLRNILITSDLSGGIRLLLKPNSVWLNKSYLEVKEGIIKLVKKYQNGK